MSFPCVNTGQFDMVDGVALQPKAFMQWRHVAVNTLASLDASYASVSATDLSVDLGEVQVAWTNTSPIAQKVYCLATRGCTKVVTQARNISVVDTFYGLAQGVAPADPATSTQIGRYGNGSDGGTVAGGVIFLITETRAPERTYQVGDTITLPAGQQIKVRVRLRFVQINRETSAIDGGNTTETEHSVTTGATRLDLFAYPSL